MQKLLVNPIVLTLLLFVSCKSTPTESTRQSDSVKNDQYLKATENRYTAEITKNRTGFDAYVHRALTRIMLKDYTGALSDCQSAIKIDPKKCPHFVVGEARAGLNDYTGAIDAFTNEIKDHPDNDLGYSRRAEAEQKIKNMAAALDDYDSAIRVSPTYGYTYERRAVLELQMNKKNEALADFKKASELGVKNTGVSVTADGK